VYPKIFLNHTIFTEFVPHFPGRVINLNKIFLKYVFFVDFIDSADEMTSKFHILSDKILGSGEFGKVYEGTEIETNKKGL